MTDANQRRILIVTSLRSTSDNFANILKHLGHASYICEDDAKLIQEVGHGVGAIIMTEALLTEDVTRRLASAFAAQPAWSKIPILLFTNDGSVPRYAESLNLVAHLVPVTTDIPTTGLKTLMDALLELRARQYEIGRLHAQLDVSHRVRMEFLSNISHEIRTPLCAILGFSELALHDELSRADRAAYLSIIRRNAQTVSSLFDNILDLTRMETDPIEINPFECRISDLLGDVVASMGQEAAKKGLALTVQRLDEVNDNIRVDLARLEQVLLYIVGNAIKFTSHGSVVVRVLAANEKLQFEVEDTGIGISKEQSVKLFQPFMQGDSSASRRYGGAGLGLALARKLARALGGDLNLKWSVPGGGSCFTLSIPVARPATLAQMDNVTQIAY